MADWAAIPSAVYSQPQPSHSNKNVRILCKSLVHSKRDLGRSETRLFVGRKDILQQYQGQYQKHFFALGQSYRGWTRGLLWTPCYHYQKICSLDVLAFGDMGSEHYCERKHRFSWSTSCFASCLKERCSFSSSSSGLLNDSVWNHIDDKHSRGYKNSSRFQCFAALIDVGNVMSMEWTSAVDEVLLATSVVLAYMAGIVTPRSQISGRRQNDIANLDNASADNILSRLEKKETQNNVDDFWNTVQRKLTAAMNVIEKFDSYGTVSLFLERENPGKSNMISLQAIEKGPRLRLLWTTLEHLHKEIGKIPLNGKDLDQGECVRLLLDILDASVGPVYARWLQEEHRRNDCILSKEVGNMIPDDFKRNNLVLLRIKNSGKEDLYADLLYNLRFGKRRAGSCCSHDLLVKHGVDILEDLVIELADGIATFFLEVISTDRTNLVKPYYISTRALERFRNEVALNRWLEDNFLSVVAIYEDRFNLWTFETVPHKVPPATKRSEYRWWKKMKHLKMVGEEPLEDIVITQVLLPMKRTKELRALLGWRYYYSVFLEISDIVGPLLRDFCLRIGRGISFLLVSLIGRSVGLICQGIRQSVSGKP